MVRFIGVFGLMLVSVLGSAGTELRDPTRPLGYGPSAVEKQVLRLDSVLISATRKVAVINGRTVAENEWISGAQVKRIQPGKVVVIREGHEEVLTVRTSVRNTRVNG